MSASPLSSPVVHTVSTSAAGIYHERWERADRPWLCMTHGAFCDLRDFAPFTDSLARTHNLLLWDLPGHGRSRQATPARRLDHAAAALVGLLDASAIDKITLLGCSFGGMVAQQFARAHADRTSALIGYVCVPIFMSPVPAPGLIALATRAQFAVTPMAQFADAFSVQASVVTSVQESFRANIVTYPPALRMHIWEAMIYGGRDDPDFDFACPVGLITGARDDRFPGARERMLAWGARLPAGRHIDIADAGHLVHAERPQEFLGAVDALLGRLSS